MSKFFLCPLRLLVSQIIRFGLILSNLGQLTDNIRVWLNIYNLSHKHETCFIHSRPTRSVFELLVKVRTGDASRKVKVRTGDASRKVKVGTGDASRKIKVRTGDASRKVKVRTGDASRKVKVRTGDASRNVNSYVYWTVHHLTS